MNEEALFRDRVRERDLDNLLVEELHASEPFRRWLVSRMGGRFVAPWGLRIRVSKSPQRLQDNRQTDVRIGWYEDDDLVACILIESKVTADFQPGQAASYAEELCSWRAALGQAAVCAALVAPRAKFPALMGREVFDACIAIEEVGDFLLERIGSGSLDAELSERLDAKVQLLDALVGKRQGSAWTPITLPEKRNFSDRYAALAAEEVPSLTVRKSTDGPGATTKFFEGAKLPKPFPSVRIKHELGKKVETKYAALQFDGLAHMHTEVARSGLLERTDFSLVEAGKALAVRRSTPGIDPTAPFAPQRSRIIEGLAAVRDLVAWLETNATEIAVLFSQRENGAEAATAGVDNVTPEKREREMRAALLDIYRQCERVNYRPRYLLDMMEDLGAIAAVRRLINGPISDGFVRLTELGKLEWSVEALALQQRWEGLFTSAELQICRRRLGIR